MLQKKLLIFMILTISFSTINAQRNIIQQIRYKNNFIILNGKKAYEYKMDGIDFFLNDLEGNELITGKLHIISDEIWEYRTTFKMVDKVFYHEEVRGMRHLIEILAVENIFQTDLKINKKRLLRFIKKTNQLKE